MKIYAFTIRSKADNSIIFAEGAQHGEYRSDFDLNKEWLSEADLTERNEA